MPSASKNPNSSRRGKKNSSYSSRYSSQKQTNRSNSSSASTMRSLLNFGRANVGRATNAKRGAEEDQDDGVWEPIPGSKKQRLQSTDEDENDNAGFDAYTPDTGERTPLYNDEEEDDDDDEEGEEDDEELYRLQTTLKRLLDCAKIKFQQQKQEAKDQFLKNSKETLKKIFQAQKAKLSQKNAETKQINKIDHLAKQLSEPQKEFQKFKNETLTRFISLRQSTGQAIANLDQNKTSLEQQWSKNVDTLLHEFRDIASEEKKIALEKAKTETRKVSNHTRPIAELFQNLGSELAA